ncbi:MAG: hypothetical protein LBR17_03455 [Bacteroidales bacterium]|jgi:hypothetical protein|nr:hypothetical protein [Bacteroidales bacterium]
MSDFTNMNYRFVWDTEPTDEQLEVIMQEVCEQAKEDNDKNIKAIYADIQKKVEQLKQIYAL